MHLASACRQIGEEVPWVQVRYNPLTQITDRVANYLGLLITHQREFQIMSGTCIGTGCKVRFKDLAKSRSSVVRNILQPQYSWLHELLNSEGTNITILDLEHTEAKICDKCDKCFKRYVIIDKLGEASDSQPLFDISQGLPSLSLVNLYYGASSNRKCSICPKYLDAGLIVLPKPARFQLIVFRKVWCPSNPRVCSDHLIGKYLGPNVKEIDLKMFDHLRAHLPDRSEKIINDLLGVSHSVSVGELLSLMDFSKMSNADCKAWIGWSLEHFKLMFDTCENQIPKVVVPQQKMPYFCSG